MSRMRRIISAVAYLLTAHSGAFAMDIQAEDVDVGVFAASARAIAHLKGLEVGPERIAQTRAFIIDVFAETEEEDWSRNAVQLAAETIAIGIFAREYFNHPALETDEVIEFLPALGKIYNSWTH